MLYRVNITCNVIHIIITLYRSTINTYNTIHIIEYNMVNKWISNILFTNTHIYTSVYMTNIVVDTVFPVSFIHVINDTSNNKISISNKHISLKYTQKHCFLTNV
jgi:hypothetical protein